MKISKNLSSSLGQLGKLLIMIGILLLVPILVAIYYSEWMYNSTNIYLGYLVPAFLSISTGYYLETKFKIRDLNLIQGLLLTGLAWIILSIFGSIPFILIADMSVINAYFETVSGFTTTGITMITNINSLPKSTIFWRSIIQWIGGLGIITFFLFIGGKGISEHSLFRGESHKIKSSQPVPNIARTIKILWIIYGSFTVLMALLLWIQGISLFDGLTHAFTALSTGGFSPHDASIGFYRENGFANFKLIEYTITFFMFLGGTNFVIHYRFFKGEISSLWDNLEMKLWWIIISGSTALIMFEAYNPGVNLESLFRNTIFQVVSIGTTTGYETQWIGSNYFPAIGKQIFLILMVIGGCVNSTGGGIKVKRLGIMIKGSWNRIKRFSRPRRMLSPLMIDGEQVNENQLERVFVIFTIWIFLLVIGGFVTALLSNHNPFQSFSGMFSALGNIGPSFMTVSEVVNLNPVVKILYIFGMLVGRLEVIPIFVLFNKEIWRR